MCNTSIHVITSTISFKQGVHDANITTIVDKHNELRYDPEDSITAEKMLLMVSYLKYLKLKICWIIMSTFCWVCQTQGQDSGHGKNKAKG